MPESLDQCVLAFIRRHALLCPGDRLAVAVSGGADSVALLRLMLDSRADLGIVLSVVHFNHKIRGEAADADERFVRDLAGHYKLDFHSSAADTPAFAKAKKLSLETAARKLRYAFFRAQLAGSTIDRIATAHTRDDQAETVLLRILRGTGTSGLAGIYPELICDPVAIRRRSIIRPLLSVRRPELEAYLRSLGQPWREDATNLDVKHTRNRVRHVLLPLLESEFNPAVRDRLAELAEIARAEELASRDRIRTARSRVTESCNPTECRLSVPELLELPLALRRRILRDTAEQLGFTLDFGQVEEVLSLCDEPGQQTIELSGNWMAEHRTVHAGRQSRRELILARRSDPKGARGYSYVLAIPGEVRVPELNCRFGARLLGAHDLGAPGPKVEDLSGKQSPAGYNESQLLDRSRLASELTVRNWRPGDRFWPAHTSAPHKVKELLQQRHVTGHERDLWPVIVSGGEIIWLRGFPVPQKYRAEDHSQPVLEIQEKPDQVP